ncbi:MAG: hypothetical protein FWH55_14840 [Oscillospiraceae bacterium]|nr:hypothetical protein [Oscillospiraceae bacterium]
MLLLSFSSCSSRGHEGIIKDFVSELNTQNNTYASWLSVTPKFAYELYDSDFVNVVATLYYMREENKDTGGYVIIDASEKIIEFSLGEPYYDTYPDSKAINRSGDKVALQMSKENVIAAEEATMAGE